MELTLPPGLAAALVAEDAVVFRLADFPRHFNAGSNLEHVMPLRFSLSSSDVREAIDKAWPGPALSVWDAALTSPAQAQAAAGPAIPAADVQGVWAMACPVAIIHDQKLPSGELAFKVCRTPTTESLPAGGGQGHCSIFGWPCKDPPFKQDDRKHRCNLRDAILRQLQPLGDELQPLVQRPG